MPDSTSLIFHLRASEKQLSEVKTILLQSNLEKAFLGIREEYWTHVILPVCIPILAFLIGRLYTTTNDKLKLLSNLKEKQRYLSTWVNLIEEPIRKQAKIYNEYAIGLKELKTEQLLVLNIHLDKLKVIDSITLVSLFVTNRVGNDKLKNTLLFKFENTVDALKRKDESTKDLIIDLKEVIKTTFEVWNNNYKEVQEIIQELHSVGNSLSNPEVINSILEIFATYTQVGERGMFSCMKHFVSKVGPICSDYINDYPQDEIMRKLMNSIGQLKFAYDSLSKHCFVFSDLFSEASLFIIEKYETLLQVKNEIATLKYKNFFLIK